MKIYTKTGDKGKTSLFGNARVDKDDIRIEAYGTVDELNSFLGRLIQQIKKEEIVIFLQQVQSKLFDIGSNLAADPDFDYELPKITSDDIERLEKAIDKFNEDLEPLKTFILPGGSLSNADAHICRTICRRAERRVVSLSKTAEVDPTIIIYINRLSDYFFILSRWLLKSEGIDEIPWVSK